VPLSLPSSVTHTDVSVDDLVEDDSSIPSDDPTDRLLNQAAKCKNSSMRKNKRIKRVRRAVLICSELTTRLGM
jgi:hypothetical protein